jgi:ribose transport system permease protein
MTTVTRPVQGTDPAPVDPTDTVISRRSVFARLRGRQEAAVLTVLVVLIIVFGSMRPGNFPTVANFQNIAQDASILLVEAVGITFVTVMGMFDLSIGSVLVFSGVICVKVMAAFPDDPGTAIALGVLAAIASGVCWGIVNGILIAKLRLAPFIVTLATLGAALGAAQIVSNGQDLQGVPASLTTAIGSATIAGVPLLAVIAIVVAVIGGLVLHKTVFGKRTYAVGSNAEAVRRAGVNVDRHVITVYAIVGATAGFSGFLEAARFATTSLTGHGDDALAAITAVALGGASLLGGIGTMLGSAIGVTIPVVLQNGLTILGIQPYWYEIIVAAALVASVYIDRRRRKNVR